MADAGRIRVLPSDVVNRIAAGEVVERPASVVKELVENSLDAGATRVHVEVAEGGKSLIRVEDDGHGMGPEDLGRVFISHSTSKLTDVDDLLHIGTLGFRGEALASVGAVARATVISRPEGAAEGWSVTNEFGRIGTVRPAAAPPGTRVEAVDLFRNVPARAKFLKSKSAELARIAEDVTRFAIAYPEVEFRLTHGGRVVCAFSVGADRRERIARAFGRELLDELIEADGESAGIHIEALLAPPSITHRDTTRILFFLNGRFIRDRTLMHAARQAYEDLLFGPRQPVLFAFLTMDPQAVDQNVHPAKLEVRFRESGRVHGLVHRVFREALTTADLRVPVRFAPEGDREKGVREAVSDYLDSGGGRPAPRGLFPGGVPGAGRPKAGGELPRAIDFLQVRNTYIVVETDEGISIMDQHALHERVLYDRVKSRYLAGEVEIQRFLAPAVVELSAVETAAVLEVKEELKAIGLLVDDFGGDAVAVHGLPAAASSADPAAILEGVLERLNQDRRPSREDMVESLLATIACRAAVKAGDRLDRETVADLLAAAEVLQHAHTCPHGRPTSLGLTYASLERHFKRK